jgi:hypothetical protein
LENSTGDFPNRLTPVNKSEIRHWSGKSGNSEKVFRIKAEIGPFIPPLYEGGIYEPNRNQPTNQIIMPTISEIIAAHKALRAQRVAAAIEAMRQPSAPPPPPPRVSKYPQAQRLIGHATARWQVGREVLDYLEVPYYETHRGLIRVDQRDIDRVLKAIRRLGDQGLLKFDNAAGVNAD